MQCVPTTKAVKVIVFCALFQTLNAVALNGACEKDCQCTATVTNSKCDTTASTKTCVCATGYSAVGGACKSALGSPCTQDSDCDTAAVTGTVCDTLGTPMLCALKSGATCSGGATDYSDKCVSHATCTSTTCSCSSGYNEDGTSFLCEASLGTSCTSTINCDTETATGTICDTSVSSPVCAIGAGAVCHASGGTDNTAHCVSNSDCSGNSNTECACTASDYTADATSKLCDANIDIGCTADADCATGLVCDSSLSPAVCKKAIGQNCGAASECVSPATCSTTCKVGLNVACTQDTDCSETGAVCESLLCKLKVGATCTSNTDKCVSNAACSGTTCSCSTGYTQDSGPTYCLADAGSSCTLSTDCKSTLVCDLTLESPVCRKKLADCGSDQTNCVGNSECTGTTCTCKTGYSEDGTSFLCVGGLDAECAVDGGCIGTGIVCDTQGSPTKCKYQHNNSGGTCTSDAQCVSNANCDTVCGTCSCSTSAATGDKLCNAPSGTDVSAVVSVVLMAACFLTTLM